jgi:hypothetical protein
MKSDADTFFLLWGGPLSPASTKRIMYWAVNEKGALCGIILPAAVWSRVEKVLSSPTELEAPYLTIAVSDISSPTPNLRVLTLDADTLYDFCYLKNAVYRARQTPLKLKIDPGKLTSHIGLAEIPALASLKRFGSKPDKGEFFTFMPDKARVELYYLIEEGETPPDVLGVQVLWGLKGFGLPAVATGTGYRPAEAEKAMLGRSAVKPLPMWLRRLGRLFQRRRPRRF